ncbi:MAG: hypothetical protein SGI89_12205 [bacterium]|nr:hypothetical protein [bacterium]
MKIFKNLTRIHSVIIALLVCTSGVLGYLFYDSHRTNIQNRELIADTKIENKDLSQDLDIVMDKYDKLRTEVNVLKSKVAKVSYKKHYPKKKKLYSAGKSSKNKHKYIKSRVNYKKLYFQLKKECRVNSKHYKRR